MKSIFFAYYIYFNNIEGVIQYLPEQIDELYKNTQY